MPHIAFVRMSVAELETAFRETVGAVFSAGPSSRRQEIRKQTWRNNPEMRPWASARCSFI